MGQTNVFTYTLSSDTMQIDAIHNVVRISIQCSSGTVSLLGSSRFNNLSPTPISFAVGEGITLTADNISTPLDGLTIDASSGTCDIVLAYQ